MRCFLFVLSLCACSRAPDATHADAASSASVAASAASSAPVAVHDAGAPCRFDRGFAGAVSGEAVFARLTRTGATIAGEYFYAKVGEPLALDGTLDASGVHLTERANNKPTGRFEGSCASGALRGTWTRAGSSSTAPFELTPVDARPAPLVAVRRRKRHYPPRPNPTPPTYHGFDLPRGAPCGDDVAWPEIYGASTPAIESKINAALVQDGWLFDESELADVERCKIGERATAVREVEVKLAERGVVAVRVHDTFRWEAGTHPYDPSAEVWMTVDAETGAIVKRDDLVVPGRASRDALRALLARCGLAWAKTIGVDAVPDALSPDNPNLLVAPTPAGLAFAATGFPPIARVLEGVGPTIPWASLAGAGVLPTGSPIARLWSDVAPRASGDPCASK